MITPFSGKNYSKNEERVKGKGVTPCAHCGKPLKPDHQNFWVEVYAGGAEYARENIAPRLCDPDFASGYMGCYSVGPDCRALLEADGVIVKDSRHDDDGPEPTIRIPGEGWAIV